MSIRTAISELFTPAEPTRLELRANLEQPTTPLAGGFNLITGGTPTASGENINEQTAMEISTVYACTRVIAESLGTLPIRVQKAIDKGSEVSTDHSLAPLFSNAPNPDMSPAVFIETLAGQMALWGNGYAEIVRDSKGNVLELYPRNPRNVDVVRLNDGSLGYVLSEGPSQTDKRTIPGKNMIHVPLLSGDGLKGLSPIAQARQELGLTVAAQKAGARYFGNGSRPGGILMPKVPVTNTEQLQQAKAGWEQMTSGINQGRLAVLNGEWSYQAIGLSLEDSQFLETRGFQRAQIAALFRVPSHMIGDTTRMSNGNAEQANLSLLQDTLQPYIVKIEAEMQRKLLPPTGRTASIYSIKFDVSERLRADQATLGTVMNQAHLGGAITANEWREAMGFNPLGPECDVTMSPVNMLNSKTWVDWNPQQPMLPVSEPKAAAEAKSHIPFQPLIRDAIGRLRTRQKPDSDTFQSLFGPCLRAMCNQAVLEARIALSLSADWSPDTAKITAETLRSIEHRSSKWTADHDATAADETQRIYKALKVNIYRDAASALALQEAA